MNVHPRISMYLNEFVSFLKKTLHFDSYSVDAYLIPL